MRHLDNQQRKIELASAVYIGGLGSYIGAIGVITDKPVVAWLVAGHAFDERTLATVMCLSGLLWALGVYINGRWFYSPFLRFASLCVNISIALLAVTQGAGTSAGYTYLWVLLLLLTGAANAARDCKAAIIGARGWNQN